MKRYVCMKVCGVLTALAILGIGQAAEADFLIRLRGGREIVVDRYWESGDQIRYKRFGGEIGISKTRVAIIENRKTGEKRILNPFYTVQELEALRKGKEAALRRRQRRQEGRIEAPGGAHVEMINVDAKRTFGGFRLLGEVRNISDRKWTRATMLVRVYRKPFGEFAGQFHVSISPSVIYPGGTGTFDARIPSDLALIWHDSDAKYEFLRKAE